MASLKIAVGGAHSTGKSTFIRGVHRALQDRGVESCIVTDLAVRCPLPILRQHTVESTLWIVTTGIAEEIAACHRSPVVLVDRPVIDAWAYLMAVGGSEAALPNSPATATLRTAVLNWLPSYSLLYRSEIDVNIAIENDKSRDLDPLYRAEVGRQMLSAYETFGMKSRVLNSTNADSELLHVVEFVEDALTSRVPLAADLG